MADFYVNYGSKQAELVASYNCGSIKIKLHRVHSLLFVLSKNRKIIHEYDELTRAIHGFHILISMEAPDLFV